MDSIDPGLQLESQSKREHRIEELTWEQFQCVARSHYY